VSRRVKKVGGRDTERKLGEAKGKKRLYRKNAVEMGEELRQTARKKKKKKIVVNSGRQKKGGGVGIYREGMWRIVGRGGVERMGTFIGFRKNDQFRKKKHQRNKRWEREKDRTTVKSKQQGLPGVKKGGERGARKDVWLSMRARCAQGRWGGGVGEKGSTKVGGGVLRKGERN